MARRIRGGNRSNSGILNAQLVRDCLKWLPVEAPVAL